MGELISLSIRLGLQEGLLVVIRSIHRYNLEVRVVLGLQDCLCNTVIKCFVVNGVGAFHCEKSSKQGYRVFSLEHGADQGGESSDCKRPHCAHL